MKLLQPLCDCIFSSSHIYHVVTTLRVCWAPLHLRRLAEVLSPNLRRSGCQELQRLPGAAAAVRGHKRLRSRALGTPSMPEYSLFQLKRRVM